MGVDLLRQPIVGPLSCISPHIGKGAEFARELVLIRRAGVADHLASRFVVMLEHRLECHGGGVLVVGGGHVAENLWSRGTMRVGMAELGFCGDFRSDLGPPECAGLLMEREICVCLEIEGKNSL